MVCDVHKELTDKRRCYCNEFIGDSELKEVDLKHVIHCIFGIIIEHLVALGAMQYCTGGLTKKLASTTLHSLNGQNHTNQGAQYITWHLPKLHTQRHEYKILMVISWPNWQEMGFSVDYPFVYIHYIKIVRK